MPEKTNGDKVRDSLVAAGVEERLATGIVDILIQAGCILPAAKGRASEVKQASNMLPPASRSRVALPTLVLTYEQRTDVRQSNNHGDTHSPTSPTAINASVGVLRLTPEMRVITFKRNSSRLSFTPQLLANAPGSDSARTLH